MTKLRKTVASSSATLLAAAVGVADDAQARTADPGERSSEVTSTRTPSKRTTSTVASGTTRRSVVPSGAEPPPAQISATDTATECFKGYGCSYAEITCSWVPGIPGTACLAEGEAIRYSPGAFLWVDYILYGPGFTVIDSGRRYCGLSRPCDIEGGAALAYIGGDFAMCVNSWVAGNNDIPMACARVVV